MGGCSSVNKSNIYNAMTEKEKLEIVTNIANKMKEKNCPTLRFRRNTHDIYQSKVDGTWSVDYTKVKGKIRIDLEYDFLLWTNGFMRLRIDSIEEFDAFLIKLSEKLSAICKYAKPYPYPNENRYPVYFLVKFDFGENIRPYRKVIY